MKGINQSITNHNEMLLFYVTNYQDYNLISALTDGVTSITSFLEVPTFRNE